MQTAIFLSKYPGEPHFIPLPLSTTREPERVSVHPHRLQLGAWLVFEWEWDGAIGEWQQQRRPVTVATLCEAIEFVPPGFDEIDAGDFAQLAFARAS